jgi:hypothetical protein
MCPSDGPWCGLGRARANRYGAWGASRAQPHQTVEARKMVARFPRAIVMARLLRAPRASARTPTTRYAARCMSAAAAALPAYAGSAQNGVSRHALPASPAPPPSPSALVGFAQARASKICGRDRAARFARCCGLRSLSFQARAASPAPLSTPASRGLRSLRNRGSARGLLPAASQNAAHPRGCPALGRRRPR